MSDDETFIVPHVPVHSQLGLPGHLQNTHTHRYQGFRSSEATSSLSRTNRQAEVVLVLAVDGVGEVLVAGLRETVLLIQDVQDPYQLGLHQVWKQDGESAAVQRLAATC